MFIYHTAVLNRFDVDVCRFVTGLTDAGKILNQLYRMDLFLAPLDSEQKWYGYHKLFSEAVTEWLRISSPGLFEQTQKKAASWFAKQDYLEDAFHYALASGDFEFTADLMEDYMIFLFERYEMASSLKWLSKLPREIFLNRPLLRLFECACIINNMKLTDAVSVLADIGTEQNKALERYIEPKKTLCDLLVYLKTALNYYQDIFNDDTKTMDEETGKISPANRPLAGYIRILIAATHIYQGNLKQAQEQIKTASFDIFPSESLLAKMNWVLVMASMYRLKGLLKQSEKTIEDAYIFLNMRKSYDTSLKYLLYLPKAWIFYHRNELDKALEYGLAGLRYTELAGNIDCILQGYHLVSLIFMAKGNHEEAVKYNQKLRSLSKEIDQPGLSDYAHTLSAALSIGQGDIGFAIKWQGEQRLQMTEPFSIVFIIKAMTMTIIHLRLGKLPQAIDLLEKLRDRCAKRNLDEILLNIDLLLSGVLWMLGKNEPSMSIMKKALLFSETQGYIRPFANYSQIISPLLEDMSKNSPESGHSVYFNACSMWN